MATITDATAERISNVGEEELWEVKATATSGDRINMPSNVPVLTTSKIKVVSVNNVTDGTSSGEGVEYSPLGTNIDLEYNGTGSSDDIRIEFRIASN
jgi:hypothetical protein